MSRFRTAPRSAGSASPRASRSWPRLCSGPGAPRSLRATASGAPAPIDDLVELAESLGRPSSTSRCTTASTSRRPHPLSAGMLPPVDALIQEKLSGARRGLPGRQPRLLGPLLHGRRARSPSAPQILQLDEDRAELGRNYPRPGSPCTGGIGPTVRAITGIVSGRCPGQRLRHRAAKQDHARGTAPGAPTSNGSAWIPQPPPTPWSPGCRTAPS